MIQTFGENQRWMGSAATEEAGRRARHGRGGQGVKEGPWGCGGTLRREVSVWGQWGGVSDDQAQTQRHEKGRENHQGARGAWEVAGGGRWSGPALPCGDLELCAEGEGDWDFEQGRVWDHIRNPGICWSTVHMGEAETR